MKRLVHGCYDGDTLKTLIKLRIEEIAFDLRGTSPSLIPFHQLKKLLFHTPLAQVILIFQNDTETTVRSFLDLLKDVPSTFTLEFRDTREVSYYESFNRPFIWMFNPEANWRPILSARGLKGILLPMKYQEIYRLMPEFWKALEDLKIDIYLHGENVKEASFIGREDGVNLSFDLNQELELSFRQLDQEKLRNLQFWRMNEHSFGQ